MLVVYTVEVVLLGGGGGGGSTAFEVEVEPEPVSVAVRGQTVVYSGIVLVVTWPTGQLVTVLSEFVSFPILQ
jgi:hypothetical protein